MNDVKLVMVDLLMVKEKKMTTEVPFTEEIHFIFVKHELKGVLKV